MNDKINDRVNDYVNDHVKADNDSQNISEYIITDLSKLVVYILQEPGKSRKHLSQIIDKGSATIGRYIKLLRDANIIEYIGSDKTGGYYLTTEAKSKLEKD